METPKTLSGKSLEILLRLATKLGTIKRQPTAEATLHSRIQALVSFSAIKATDLGEWMDGDTDKDLAERVAKISSGISRPRLDNRKSLRGLPGLKKKPTSQTILKLLSPSGAKYQLSTLTSHFLYIVIYCADMLTLTYDDETRDEVDTLAGSIFRSVLDEAHDQYRIYSAGTPVDDEIKLDRARSLLRVKDQDWWRNINVELAALRSRLNSHPIEGRQMAAAFLLGDRPTLAATMVASASRASSDIVLEELSRAKTSIGLWVRGAVGSGKTTILYQIAIRAADEGRSVSFIDGLAIARHAPEHISDRIRDLSSTSGALVVIDNAEFLSPDVLLRLSQQFMPRENETDSHVRALVLATQTERLAVNQLNILRQFVQSQRYSARELRRDSFIYADRLVYPGRRSDIEALAQAVHSSDIAGDFTIVELRAQLSRTFNERRDALLLSALLGLGREGEIKSRISTSIQSLVDHNSFAQVPGLDRFPGPLAMALGVVALCRYRYASLSRRKFFCDESLIASCLSHFFEADTGTATSVTKRIIELLSDELLFAIDAISVSPTDPWLFGSRTSSGRVQYPDQALPTVSQAGLVDTRHPDVTEAIYRVLFRPSADGRPAPFNEADFAILVGNAARQCALSGKYGVVEHDRTFRTLGRSFDSRVRDTYFDYFSEWVERDRGGNQRESDLAGRFALDAAKAYIDSLLEIGSDAHPKLVGRYRDSAQRMLAAAHSLSNFSNRARDLVWVRTEVAAQRVRLAHLAEDTPAAITQLVELLSDESVHLSGSVLGALSGVIRHLHEQLPEATLDRFETACGLASRNGELHSGLYMELGRYARDVRKFTIDLGVAATAEAKSPHEQAFVLFKEALGGEYVSDYWYVELLRLCEAYTLLPVSSDTDQQDEASFPSQRAILRHGVQRFSRSPTLLANLCDLEITQAEEARKRGDLAIFLKSLGDLASPELLTIRHLSRQIVDVQLEKAPVSLANILMPVVGRMLPLEAECGFVESVLDERLERYSFRWWISFYLSGGKETGISLAKLTRLDLSKDVRLPRVIETASSLWTKAAELAKGGKYPNAESVLGAESLNMLALIRAPSNVSRAGGLTMRSTIESLKILNAIGGAAQQVEALQNELRRLLQDALDGRLGKRSLGPQLLKEASVACGDVNISMQVDQYLTRIEGSRMSTRADVR